MAASLRARSGRLRSGVLFVVLASLSACATPARPADSSAAIPTGTAPASAGAVVATAACVPAADVVLAADRADRAMRDIATSASIGAAHASADLLERLIRDLLPRDTDGPADGPLASLIQRTGPAASELDQVALGGLQAWTRPGDRFDQWRAVVAAWRPDRNTMPELPSHLLRALGWATLVGRTDDLGTARGLAGIHGVIHTGLVLAAARALAAQPLSACP